MWIFDSYFKGCVELWSRERGLERISAAYPPSFYMHLKDPHAHWEMIQTLETGWISDIWPRRTSFLRRQRRVQVLSRLRSPLAY